jgi:hypothetical protein
MLYTPYNIYRQAAAAGIRGIWWEVKCDEA